jgi:hypothetical protein
VKLALAALFVAISAGCQAKVREQAEPVFVAVAVRPVSPPASAEPPSPPREAGVWVESDAYDLKLVTTARCESGRLGLQVRLRSKAKSFFSGPRDAVLYDGEHRYEALRAPDDEGCKPALAPATLRRGKESEGFLVFDVARGAEEPVLEFAPTRWGGAGSVRVAVAEAPP